uniref:Right handed beta helix domain-containing protein n=1 Tax=Amphimedon queenslandica TaxID=400682 RepID=A0A1X7UMR0_AMPQE
MSNFFVSFFVLSFIVTAVHCTVILVAGENSKRNESIISVRNLTEALELVENKTYTFNVTILLNNTKEVLNRDFRFDGITNFSLLLSDRIESSIIRCTEAGKSGLSFFNSSNISIIRVVFGNCGSELTSNLLTVVWPAVFAFEHVENITIINSIFSSSKGTALKLLNCRGQILLGQVIFSKAQVHINNRRHDLVGGGSIYILQTRGSSSITMDHCILSSNRLIGEAYTKGGAIAAVYHTANNSMNIRSSYMNGNHAMQGSCLYLAFVGTANRNTVLVTASNIYGHKCYNSTSGSRVKQKCVGTLSIQYLLDPHSLITGYNNVSFHKGMISKNVAFSGGAISVSAVRQSTKIAHTNSFSIRGIKLEYNRAEVGSTYFFSVLPGPSTGYLLMPVIEGRIISSFITNKSNVTVGQGIVYSNKMSIRVEPPILEIKESMGTGIVMSGAQLIVLPGTSVIFKENIGKLGGAIALLNQASLIVMDGSKLIFYNNTANDKGGAIYASNYFDNYALPMTRVQCTIQFSNTSSFIFQGNTADHEGNSIFATSVLSCAENKLVNYSELSPFCWSNWHYKDSTCILLPNTVYSANGEVKGMKLLYMDASVEYGSSKHIWLMMISIIVLSLIVIPLPLILLLYPLQVVQRCLHRTHLNHRALRAFMDSFQGCYRIGTEDTRDARSFSCVYFILRIVVLGVMMSAMDSVVEGMLQVMTMIMVMCLIVTVQPYKKEWNNTLDVFMFSVMILIKVTMLVQSESHQLGKGFISLSITLILLPLVYMSVYVSRKITKRCCKK